MKFTFGFSVLSPFMPLPQLDRVLNWEPNRSLRAVKNLTLSEEYLQDHFPLFPVMPGVMMLEAMFQASAWLLRASDDFAVPLVQLLEARAIKYQGFVAPGDRLVIEVAVLKRDSESMQVKVTGTVDSRTAVSGRLIVGYGSASNPPAGAIGPVEYLRREHRRLWSLLQPQTTPND